MSKGKRATMPRDFEVEHNAWPDLVRFVLICIATVLAYVALTSYFTVRALSASQHQLPAELWHDPNPVELCWVKAMLEGIEFEDDPETRADLMHEFISELSAREISLERHRELAGTLNKLNRP